VLKVRLGWTLKRLLAACRRVRLRTKGYRGGNLHLREILESHFPRDSRWQLADGFGFGESWVHNDSFFICFRVNSLGAILANVLTADQFMRAHIANACMDSGIWKTIEEAPCLGTICENFKFVRQLRLPDDGHDVWENFSSAFRQLDAASEHEDEALRNLK